jgi:hypothetical protein
MRQRSLQEEEELQQLLDERERLVRVASDALSSDNPRSRPNWFQFYEAHAWISVIVDQIRRLNGHE